MVRARFYIIQDCMRDLHSCICGIWPSFFSPFTVLIMAFVIVSSTNILAAPQPFLVKDINTVDSTGSSPQSLAEVNGITYFSATDGINGTELWKSNGTEAGTVLVQDIVTGPDSSDPYYLTNVNGTLFFIAYDPAHGVELWQSSGTGATLVKDIVTGPDSSNLQNLTNVNGTLFFIATDSANGTELWKSNGT
ncbi:MAG: ELWxxDGT repeat protein, partial [Thermodesulfovibrionales bacterium]